MDKSYLVGLYKIHILHKIMRSKKTSNRGGDDITSLSNTINKGTRVTGEIVASGNLRIDGEVEGQVNCKTKLVLGESSVIKGDITAQHAEIAGKVEGHIHTSETLILKSSAFVSGDVIAGQLMIETGATFNGTSKMGGAAKKANLNGVKEKAKA